MFATLKTLINGASARAEENLRDIYAIELIDEKIREASASLKAAKMSLATLIQRQRAEARQIEALSARINTLTTQAQEALAASREDLAHQAATAIADMENERTTRETTHARLDTRILQLRTSIEAAHRRLLDLRQGATSARAIRQEQTAQSRLVSARNDGSAMEEAEALIARVMAADDPFENAQILSEINADLSGEGISSRLSEAGFGPQTNSTAQSVLDRLSKK